MTKTLLVLTPYAVITPRFGGSIRIYNLCRVASQKYEVIQFAQQIQRRNIAWSFSPVIQQVTPTYFEYSSRNPLSLGRYTVTSLLWNSPPVWQSAALQASAPPWLYEQMKRADLIHVEHPWQFAWAYRHVGKQKPIVLGTQNVESSLYTPAHITAPAPLARYLSHKIEQQERFAVCQASRVLTVSAEDRVALVSRFQIAPEQCVFVPNGVDCALFAPVSQQIRLRRKQELGLEKQRVVLFAGSMHYPNREAVDQIIKWAKHWPDDLTCFLIVGNIGQLFHHSKHPRLRFTGTVETTLPFFEAADIAINPMLSGSGTNLKQLEFMALGLPTVVSPVGARGLPLEDGTHCYIRHVQNFPAQIQWVLEHLEVLDQMGRTARSFVKQYYDWPVIGEQLIAAYEGLLSK